MEEESLKEETIVEEGDLVTSHPPLLPLEPYTWLMITDVEDDSERHLFYSIIKDRFYATFVPELQNKYIACCYGGFLVLRDKSTNDCSILNILTMEKSQLPPLTVHPYDIHPIHTECVMSSPKIDGNCRVIFLNRSMNLCKFWSCHLGDSEFIERELTSRDEYSIEKIINYKGKLYALTAIWNLFASDFSDPDLHHEQVVNGEELNILVCVNSHDNQVYLVESGEDLLLIYMGSYNHDYEVCEVGIYKADFTIGEWVKLETLGDRAIFLARHSHSFSCSATTIGIKGNAIYWVKTPFSLYSPERHLYMYDIEDKSISVSLLFPVVGNFSSISLYGVPFPMTCNDVNKPEQKDRSSLFEDYSRTETNFHVQRGKATLEFTELQIEQGDNQKREKLETTVRNGSLWADLHNDLLLQIFPHLCIGETIAFRSVCRSWYSLSPSKTAQPCVLPLKSSDNSAPLLMCPDNKAYNPIHGELYSMPDIPKVRIGIARDGWLLMDYDLLGLYFYNPSTKEEIELPHIAAASYISFCFSGAPTSEDCLVVIAIETRGGDFAIHFMKCGDEDWTVHQISPEIESFSFACCNAVFYKGLFYFLGYYAKLLILNPKKDEVRVIEAPEFISELTPEGGQQYMLECDGKLIAVFVGVDGSSVYTCAWNIYTSKWETVESLGDIMLFVSRPLSICKRATVSGTGNKIYFPRVVGDDGQILFYSLATKRYHTFEMGTSYPNFLASKYYPQYNGWFVP